jgi:hypothetical protein
MLLPFGPPGGPSLGGLGEHGMRRRSLSRARYNVDNDSVAKQMNRGLFLAPDLDNDEDDDPLLEQARENVDDDVDEIEEKRERKAEDEKDRR